MKKTINDLFVYTSGNKNNKPIIFVHGFPYDHMMWKEQIKEFSQNYFCVAYDIRGLGQSPAGNGQFTMESFVDDLETIVNELKPEKPILCGLSMGGYISLRALERMQDKLSAAILCDTKSEADHNEGKLKRAAGIKRINTEGLAPFVKDFITNCFGTYFRQNKQQELDRIIETSSQYDPAGVKGCLLAMLGRTDTTAYLEKINIPTLLICGEQDSLTPPAVMKEMQNRIKNAEYVEIENAGHMTPIEKPEEVNSAIKNFLKKL
ncbi:MAG TPA: alpha/beta hydrolase [Ignavibacteriaceae bacterium]|nr:alpha/beta hydrolase [Ignavibacteriaceae bacterium]